MLDLNTLLWVVPGVIFIYVYNKRRPVDSITVAGWPYLFSLVFIALLFWLPVETLLNDKLDDFGKWQTLVVPATSGFIAFLTAFFFTSIGNITTVNFRYLLFVIIITVLIWLPFHFLLIGVEKWQILMWPVTFGISIFCLSPLLTKLCKLIPFNVQDTFLSNCADWEKKTVILSLHNNKVYIGILLKYPENPRSRHESQMISIIPLISGGRNKDTKEVKWGDYYPIHNLTGCELMIPRSEILTFGKFSEKVFKHFYSNSGMPNKFTEPN